MKSQTFDMWMSRFETLIVIKVVRSVGFQMFSYIGHSLRKNPGHMVKSLLEKKVSDKKEVQVRGFKTFWLFSLK